MDSSEKSDGRAESGDDGVDWSTEGVPAFANGIRVSAGAREFALIFTEFQPFRGRAAAPGSAEPRERVVASLRTNPEELFHMLESMAGAWNRWVLAHSKPDSVPRFRLFGARRFEPLAGSEDV